MATAYDIVRIIQDIPADNKKIKFLVSLANSWFRYGHLTENQEAALIQAIFELHEEGVL